ncbi:MAG: hypothetical protein JO051_04150, partial [Acidobacteriaceae bacterium]|nr:hypothetical protein [Acidobacteriaceae bacterium]
QLEPNLKPGTSIPITEYLQDRAAPETVPGGLQITGPLPVIASSKLSLPAGLTISTKPNEFPAGGTLTAMLDVKNIERRSTLRLACQDDSSPRMTLQIGEQNATSSLQQLSPDQLFLSVATAALPAGCQLQAVIDNGRDGRSQPFDLARIILMPQIDSFTPNGPSSNGAPTNGATACTITGQNLEMIQKVGWDASNGVNVTDLPNPIPGPGQKQTLTLTLPPVPSSAAYLNLWLRGDESGRATTIKAPPAPAAAPPAPSNATQTKAPSRVL